MDSENSIYKSFEVTAVIQETANAKSFELKPLDREGIKYEAGQFITLSFRKGDKEDRRSYSLSSAPLLNEPMQITVKRIANGEYSRQLFDHLKKGDILVSSGISGSSGYQKNPMTLVNSFSLQQAVALRLFIRY